MTVTPTKPVTAEAEPAFGVRYSGAADRETHVDVCATEEYARRFWAALRFCGNTDAELVRRDSPSGPWLPVEVTA